MKFIVLFIFLILGSFSCVKKEILLKQYANNIKIKLKMDLCVPKSVIIPITFQIHNGNSSGIWMRAWSFELLDILSLTGDKLEPEIVVEKNTPDFPEYIFIPADSTIILKYNTNFFMRYRVLRSGEGYFLKATYQKSSAKEKRNEPIITSEIEIPEVKFQVCE